MLNRAIQANVMAGLTNRFKEQFPFEVQSTRDDIFDRMPSKKKELERMAKASAEEAARIKAEMEAKERAESARKEDERLEREKQEAAAAKLVAENSKWTAFSVCRFPHLQLINLRRRSKRKLSLPLSKSHEGGCLLVLTGGLHKDRRGAVKRV